MEKKQLIKELSLGGPGLSGYAYCADTYCNQCGKAHIIRIIEGNPLTEILARSTSSYWTENVFPWVLDSEYMPQPIFFGESDIAQHCTDCGEYLYGERGTDHD